VHLVAGVRRLFDLDADPNAIDLVLARDRALRPLVRANPGMRVPGALDPFEVGVRAVLGQQVTVAGATTLAGRLVQAHGRTVAGLQPLGLTHLFPAPRTLRNADLTEIGLPAARANALRGFAGEIAGGRLQLEPGRDLAETTSALVALPGFGDWTAQYIAMRACGERDAFPAGDLGLRRALDATNAKAAATRAEAFRPWRSYAAMHLWSSLAA
jgi:AraC family transcriptional regulator of adaptative response / DNA-3-methyladenine glycosylase II